MMIGQAEDQLLSIAKGKMDRTILVYEGSNSDRNKKRTGTEHNNLHTHCPTAMCSAFCVNMTLSRTW